MRRKKSATLRSSERKADAEAGSSEVSRTSYQENTEDQTLPAPDTLPAPLPAVKGVAVNLDSVLRMTFERNGEILVSRERVNESVIALDAAMRSCMPETLRKDTFKKPVAEAQVWRRRGELRKVENDNLQDAANTYFDWLMALRAETVARDLMKYEEKLLKRARKLAEVEKPSQVLVNATETALNGRQQFVALMHQRAGAAAVKLAYLTGLNGSLPISNETLEPIDRVDTSLAVEVLVRQAQDNGPGVRELQGLIASIEQGIEQAHGAQYLCAHFGTPLVCGRLQIAQSQLHQAQLVLLNLQEQTAGRRRGSRLRHPQRPRTNRPRRRRHSKCRRNVSVDGFTLDESECRDDGSEQHPQCGADEHSATDAGSRQLFEGRQQLQQGSDTPAADPGHLRLMSRGTSLTAPRRGIRTTVG